MCFLNILVVVSRRGSILNFDVGNSDGGDGGSQGKESSQRRGEDGEEEEEAELRERPLLV